MNFEIIENETTANQDKDKVEFVLYLPTVKEFYRSNNEFAEHAKSEEHDDMLRNFKFILKIIGDSAPSSSAPTLLRKFHKFI